MRDDAISAYEEALKKCLIDIQKEEIEKKLGPLKSQKLQEGIRSGKSLEELGLIAKPLPTIKPLKIQLPPLPSP
jgi:hypothetical protein